MSGYLEGVLVLLAVNVVFAYGAFLPVAAGQLNLGLAGFAAIGAYASAFLSNTYGVTPVLAIAVGGIAAGLIALVVAVPVLRTRGIYLALATFALGQIVQATLLNLEVVGGAAGYPVTAFIRLPTIALFAAGVVVVVAVLFATRFGIAVTAVHDDVRVAVAPLERRAEVHRGEMPAGVGVHEHQVAGAHGQRGQFREQAETVQDAQGVRGQLDARADLAELR